MSKFLLLMEPLLKKIEKFESRLCVIGLGQVGLPTALSFCEAGFSVLGYDIDQHVIQTLRQRKSHFEGDDLNKILQKHLNNGSFLPISDLGYGINNSDIIIVCVATPLTDGFSPNMSYLNNACQSLATFCLDNKLVIIESSIPPGTFDNIVNKTFKNKTHTFWSAYVPERLSPGSAMEEIKNTPRLVGVSDDDSGKLSLSLYKKIINSSIHVSTPKQVEVSKLVENTFRDVNIAFANEIALICENLEIDVNELIELCNTHTRVNILKPGPGVGGPCLPKDPFLLLHSSEKPVHSDLIQNSRTLNDSMPLHVINLIQLALKSTSKSLTNSCLLVLGVAYKANVSDIRYSPSQKIITELTDMGHIVYVLDPFTDETFGGKKINDINDVLSLLDAIVVVTDHDEFKKLDLAFIHDKVKNNPILVDTRRLFDKKIAEKLGFHYHAVGYVKK